MELGFLSPITVNNHGSLSFFAGSRLSPGYGYHQFSAATGASKASFVMPLASKGAVLILDFANAVTDANYSIIASASTVIKDFSGIASVSNLNVSAGGTIKLVATADDEWSIVEQGASITAQADT